MWVCSYPFFSSGKKGCSCEGFSACPAGTSALVQLLWCHQRIILPGKLVRTSQWARTDGEAAKACGGPEFMFFPFPALLLLVCVFQMWGWHLPLDPVQWESREVCSFSCHWSDWRPFLYFPSPSCEQSWCQPAIPGVRACGCSRSCWQSQA